MYFTIVFHGGGKIAINDDIRIEFKEAIFSERLDNLFCFRLKGRELLLPFIVMDTNAKISKGYCVFVQSVSEGAVPSVFDGDNKPVVFGTREKANAEIQDYVDTRLAHAVDENETNIYLEDTEEFVVEVRILENGTVLPVF